MASTLPQSKDKLVLITGATGYVASRAANDFLEAGFSVRGTSRSLKSAQALLSFFSAYVDAGRFSIVEVPDITVPGAFDEAVKGMPIISHYPFYPPSTPSNHPQTSP
jgi:nucleoside-diphosphate-sugar epimerase